MKGNREKVAATRWWLAMTICLTLLAPPAFAAQIDVRYEDHEIPVAVYGAAGTRVILWLPPEEGIQARQRPTAEGLAARGIEVWVPDLHSAWFLAPGPHSLADVHPEAIAVLIERAGAGGRRVYLMAASRSAALALEGIRAWQTRAAHAATLGGAVLLHPKLYAGTPQGGETAEFLARGSRDERPGLPLPARARLGLVAGAGDRCGSGRGGRGGVHAEVARRVGRLRHASRRHARARSR